MNWPDEVSVSVGDSEIKFSVQGDGTWCPIAQALRSKACELLVDSAATVYVHVGRNQAQVDHVKYDLPANAKAFVRAYDAGKPVQPDTFKLTRAKA